MSEQERDWDRLMRAEASGLAPLAAVTCGPVVAVIVIIIAVVVVRWLRGGA